jgi:hypothetical protein
VKAHVRRLKQALIAAYANVAPIRAPPLVAEVLDDVRAEGDPYRLGDLLRAAATACRLIGRESEARAFLDELTPVVAALPPSRLTLGTLFVQASELAVKGDRAETRALLRDGVELARSIGADGWANSMRLAMFADADDDIETLVAEGRELLQSLRPFQMFSNLIVPGATYTLAANLARRAGPGDIDEAYRLVRGLEKTGGRALPGGAWLGLPPIMAIGDGRHADAARLLGFAQENARRLGIDFSGSQATWASLRTQLTQRLDAGELQTLAAEGARMSLDQAYDLAMRQG